MKFIKITFLMVLLAVQAFSQVWTDTIPDWDHTNIANIKIQYSGDWVHMNNKNADGSIQTGSYPKNNDARAVYKFWGFGIDIYTELMHHHEAYIVNIDGVDIDTVNVKDDRNLVDQLTFSVRNLGYSNHILELRRYQGYFVLNSLVKWVDSSPYPPAPVYLWDMPLADSRMEYTWNELPYAIFDFNDKIDNSWNVHSPSGNCKITGAGLEFIYNPETDVSNYPDWIRYRSEIREDPQGAPLAGSTDIYCMRFELNDMPDPIDHAAVTIFQLFRQNLDGPELDIELTATNQFSQVAANTIAIYAEGVGWISSQLKLKAINDLVIAVEHKTGGSYKVSFNGITLAQGAGNFHPDSDYTGPQFGIYNHGENTDFMKLTHQQYGKYSYVDKPDFNQINSILPDQPDPPCISDTVYIPKPYPVHDTIYIPKPYPVHDTIKIYAQPKFYIMSDSMIYEIINSDPLKLELK